MTLTISFGIWNSVWPSGSFCFLSWFLKNDVSVSAKSSTGLMGPRGPIRVGGSCGFGTCAIAGWPWGVAAKFCWIVYGVAVVVYAGWCATSMRFNLCSFTFGDISNSGQKVQHGLPYRTGLQTGSGLNQELCLLAKRRKSYLDSD